jgi:hypothetical protein
MMRSATPLLAILILCLPACGGVLSYTRDDTVFVARLPENDPNTLLGATAIRTIDFADDLQYAVDRSGAVVAVCRTTFPEPGLAGEFVLEVYDINGARIIHETQTSFLRKADSVGRTNLQRSVQDFPERYMHCREMGSSPVNDRLVLYLQPQGFDGGTNDIAIEFWVRHHSLSVTDFELFPRDDAPHRVVAGPNPLNGHTIAIVDGHIQVDGAPVLHDGKPVEADSVKHRFQ